MSKEIRNSIFNLSEGTSSGGSLILQYSDTEIQALITNGYIPIASSADLDAVRTVYSGASTKVFARGTKWQTAAINTLGIGGKYVQTCDINLDWTDPAILINYNAANAYTVGAVVKSNSRIYYCWANAAIGYAPTGAASDNNSWLHINTSATFTSGWAVIGAADFTGIYDGGFYWLDNFYQVRSVTYAGLIRSLNGATALIQNILMSNIRLTSTGSSYTSPVCSFVTAGGTIKKCYTNGKVIGVGDVSGMASTHAGGILEQCISDCNVVGQEPTILGRHNAGSFANNCLSRGVAVSNNANNIVQLNASGTGSRFYYNIGIGTIVTPSIRDIGVSGLDRGFYLVGSGTDHTGYWAGDIARQVSSEGGTGVIKSTISALRQLSIPVGWDSTIWRFGGNKNPFLKAFDNVVPNISEPQNFEAFDVTPINIRLEWKKPINGTISSYRLYKSFMSITGTSQTNSILAEGVSISQVGDTFFYEETLGNQRTLGWYGYYVRGVFTYNGRTFETPPSPTVIFEEVTLANQFSEGLFALSFDNGHVHWDTILTPLLVSLGVKASLFLTSQDFIDVGHPHFMTWAEAKSCYDQGMDIGCHFKNHVDLAALFTASGETAISDGLESVNDSFAVANIPIPKHMAYPLGPMNSGCAAVIKRYRQTGRPLIDYYYNGLTPSVDKWQGIDISGVLDNTWLPTSTSKWDALLYRLRRAKYSRQGISFYSHEVEINPEDIWLDGVLSSYLREMIELAQLIEMKVVCHEEFNNYLINSFPLSVVIPSDVFTFGDTTPATNDFVIIVENGKAFTINWGDTVTTSHSGTGVEQRIEHEYALAGTYAVTVSYHGNELKHFQVEQTGLNISFNLNVVPHGIETIIVNDANTATGDMKSLVKTTLSKIVLGGSNNITGDFNKIPYYVTHCDIRGVNQMSTYSGTSAAKFPMNGLNTLISIPVTTGLSQANIDSLINDLADITWGGSSKVLTLTGAHAIPSAASSASIVALQAQGVVVTVNS